MNAFDVLFDHHNTLRGLCKKITAMPPTSSERQDGLDELLVELDIHMRIEDELFRPAGDLAAEFCRRVVNRAYPQPWCRTRRKATKSSVAGQHFSHCL